MKTCPKCLTQVDDNINFCTKCGEPIGAAADTNNVARKVCPNCNAEVDTNVKFCTSCGTPLASTAEQQLMPEKKKINIDFKELWGKYQKWILIGAGVFVVLIAVIIIIALQPKTVNIGEYLEIEVDGYEGYSTFTWNLDEEAFFDAVTNGKYSSKLKGIANNSSSSVSSLIGDIQKATKAYAEYEKASNDITNALEIEVEYPESKKSNTLMNDDVVTFTFTCDEDIADQYGFKLKSDTYEYTVSGLKTAEEYDVMQYFDVEFSGIDGAGHAKIISKAGKDTIGDITFSVSADENYIYCSCDEWYNGRSIYLDIDQEDGLSEGDEITVSADIDGGAFTDNGVILKNLSKKFTVPKLDEASVFDVMQYFDISFVGIEGEGVALITSKKAEVTVGDITFTVDDNSDEVSYIKNDWDYPSTFTVSLDKSRGLKSGDTVTLTADVSETYLADYGIMLTNLSKQVKIGSLGTYLSDVSKLTNLYQKGADGSESISAQVKNILNDWMYTNWGEIVHGRGSYKDQYIGDDFKLYKAYLTTPKSSTDDTNNTLWLVYSVTLNDDSLEKNTLCYFGVAFKNVYIDGDGFSSYAFNREQDQSTWYRATDSFDDLYKDHINTYNVNVQESTPS